MKKIQSSSSMQLQLLVTGSHLSKDFGSTIEQIASDGFAVTKKVPILNRQDTGLAMAVALGKAVEGIANALAKLKPSAFLILGDRMETLAGALAATYLNIPILHIHGGDNSGSVDQPVRYAISKLAHLHLAATAAAAKRLESIGEEKRRIFITGAPGLEEISSKSFSKPHDLINKYGIKSGEPIFIVVQHPVVSEVAAAASQISETLDAVVSTRTPTIIIYPNADAGGLKMISVIKRYCKKYRFLRAYPSLPREDFLGLLNMANMIIGNSSSAIIEAPLFGLPVINVGTRQFGRERFGWTLDVDYSKHEIVAAVKRILADGSRGSNPGKRNSPYGSGLNTSDRIVRILNQTDLGSLTPKK